MERKMNSVVVTGAVQTGNTLSSPDGEPASGPVSCVEAASGPVSNVESEATRGSSGPTETRDPREPLVDEIGRLARIALQGTLSESYRTCGNPGCRCHADGPRHGPYLYVTHRGEGSRASRYYVSNGTQARAREGIGAWQLLQQRLRELAELNRQELLRQARASKGDCA
jgi:hypothetical protein